MIQEIYQSCNPIYGVITLVIRNAYNYRGQYFFIMPDGEIRKYDPMLLSGSTIPAKIDLSELPEYMKAAIRSVKYLN